jgi:hypothetical protein
MPKIMSLGFLFLGYIVGLLAPLSTDARADLSPVIAKAKDEKEVIWYTTASAADNQAIVAGFTRKYPFLRAQALRQTGENSAKGS